MKATHQERGTKADPVLVVVGLVSLLLPIFSAPAVLGVSATTYPVSTGITDVSIVLLGTILLIMLGAAFVFARGLWYPCGALSSDVTLLRGPSRRVLTENSKLGELGCWLLTYGIGMLAVGYLIGIPGLQGTMCMEGPCTVSVVPPALSLASYIGGGIAILLGGACLLRSSLFRPSHGRTSTMAEP